MRQGAFEDAIRTGAFIEGEDLFEIDWRDLPSGQVRLRGCTLRDGSLGGAELNESVFEDVTFLNCRFAGADLINTKFLRCVLFDSEARKGCDFADAQMRGAHFTDCNLSLARFAGANLHAVTLERCKAAGADFEDASLVRKSGRSSVVAGRFIDCALDFANFRGVVLEDCDFDGSSLRQADFSRTSLGKTGFRRADLSAAIIDEADMAGADLRDAVVNGLDLTRARNFTGVKVSQSQLGALVGPFGLRVFPD
ncbi:pentapeptide repeat-containing protein [uncultured Devosia sp.]|uniref:pentapeptide repeat-containing protein n=1 Tax=uncultured Devosia sp. TaxID=211434 RepID=UPI0035CA3A62